ncbi:helix-turn-helix domain-containing protein [Tsukamurella soli]
MTPARRPNRGPRAAAENRAALIAAARIAFSTEGYGAPLNGIARAAGVGQGSLYRHFPDRESLALAVFEENVSGLEVLAARPEVTLDELLTVMSEQLAALIPTLMVPSPPDPRVEAMTARVAGLLAPKVRAAADAGLIRPDVTITEMILALGMVASVLPTAPRQDRPALAEQAWALLRRGLRA